MEVESQKAERKQTIGPPGANGSRSRLHRLGKLSRQPGVDLAEELEDLGDVGFARCPDEREQGAVAHAGQADRHRFHPRRVQIDGRAVALLESTVRVGTAPPLDNVREPLPVAGGVALFAEQAVELVAPPVSRSHP